MRWWLLAAGVYEEDVFQGVSGWVIFEYQGVHTVELSLLSFGFCRAVISCVYGL